MYRANNGAGRKESNLKLLDLPNQYDSFPAKRLSPTSTLNSMPTSNPAHPRKHSETRNNLQHAAKRPNNLHRQYQYSNRRHAYQQHRRQKHSRRHAQTHIVPRESVAPLPPLSKVGLRIKGRLDEPPCCLNDSKCESADMQEGTLWGSRLRRCSFVV